MPTRSRHSSRPWRRGLTLVEVAAAMALLGTLLVSVLLAHAKLRGQETRAGQFLEAQRLADKLLATWWENLDEFPREDQGDVPGAAAWSWRTRRVPSPEAKAIEAEIVAVELFCARDDHDTTSVTRKPAVRVEVLLPLEDEGTRDAPTGSDAG